MRARIIAGVLLVLGVSVLGVGAMPVKRTQSDLVNQMIARRAPRASFNGTVRSVDDYNARLATVVVGDVTALQVRIADHIDIGTADAPRLNAGDRLEVKLWDDEYTAVALKRQVTYLPLVLVGREPIGPALSTPQWLSGNPRLTGTRWEGAWSPSVGGNGIRYQIWANTQPNASGAWRIPTGAPVDVLGTSYQIASVNTGDLSELLINGGFESGDFMGWTPSGLWTVQSAIQYDGTFAAKLDSSTTLPIAEPLTSSQFGVVESSDYVFSMYLRATEWDDPINNLIFTAYWLDSDGAPIGSDVIYDNAPMVGGFTLITDTVTAPAGAAYCYVVIEHSFGVSPGDFVVYVDNVSVVGQPPINASTLLYAVRAVDANGNASPFSAWLQPLVQAAALGAVQLKPNVGLVAAVAADRSATKVLAADASILDMSGYAVSSKGVTNGDSHDHNGGDGAQIPTGGIANDAVTNDKLSMIGTSFPGSPATNDLYFRTDLGWWCYYDGARWLTCHEYCAILQQLFLQSSNWLSSSCEVRQDYAPYISRVTISTRVNTTNNGSHYWSVQVRGINLAYGAATSIHTFTTASDTVDTIVQRDATPSATATPANDIRLDYAFQKTGSPGTLDCWGAAVFYRLIVT